MNIENLGGKIVPCSVEFIVTMAEEHVQDALTLCKLGISDTVLASLAHGHSSENQGDSSRRHTAWRVVELVEESF